MANFSCLPLEFNAAITCIYPDQVFRPIGVLNRSTQLRHSKIKYKYYFYKSLSRASPSLALKLGNLSKARRQRKRRQTEGLMSRTIAVHVRYKSLYISLPFSAKQQREITKFCVFWRT